MPSIGYRFENFLKKSIYFNIAYSPIFGFSEGQLWCQPLWAKFGVGYSF